MRPILALLVTALFISPCRSQSSSGSSVDSAAPKYTIDNCVSRFSQAKVEATGAGYQYWFVDRKFVDGRTIKLSVVAPHKSTHEPHVHPEDEFFFVLEGKAEFFLEGKTRIVGPFTSLYCPPNMKHGIRNAGSTELKYLVIKKYPVQ